MVTNTFSCTEFCRDFIMEHHWIFESFEASMAWPVVIICCEKVKERIREDCKRLGIKYPPIVMVRLTQVYDGGAVLYFYFGFNWAGLRDPVKVSERQRELSLYVQSPCARWQLSPFTT